MRTASRWLAVSVLLLASVAAVARTRPHYGGTVKVELRASGWRDTSYLHSLVFETLTTVGPHGEAQPLLAARWEEQNNARRWIFTLRAGVRWHDGTPLTADDVVRSLRSARCPGCEPRTVRAANGQVILESAQPAPELPAELALPRYALEKEGAGGVALGTGPFRVASQSAANVRLEAFNDAWQGRPFLDAVEIATARPVRDQWLDAAAGRADLVEVPAEQLRRAQQERMHIVTGPPTELIALLANPAHPPDARLRLALAATADRTAILNFVFQKQGEVAATALPNWLTGYAALFPAAPNAVRARELLAQIPNRPRLTIGCAAADTTLQLAAERIALNAREQGLNAQFVAGNNADLVLARIALPSVNAPVGLAELSALAAEPQPAGATDSEHLYRSERNLLDAAMLVPLVQVPRAFAASEHLRNLKLNALGEPELATAWIEEHR